MKKKLLSFFLKVPIYYLFMFKAIILMCLYCRYLIQLTKYLIVTAAGTKIGINYKVVDIITWK